MTKRPNTHPSRHKPFLRSLGPLSGGAALTVHTRHARALLTGRKADGQRPEITGLFHFALELRTLKDAAGNADPYAQWWLEKIASALSRADRALDAAATGLATDTNTPEGFTVEAARSATPVTFPLYFAHPLAYRAAAQVARFDAFIREAQSAVYFGVLPRDTVERAARTTAQALRNTYATALGFHQMGVQPHDIEQDNERAAAARARMGTLPARLRHTPKAPSSPGELVTERPVTENSGDTEQSFP